MNLYNVVTPAFTTDKFQMYGYKNTPNIMFSTCLLDYTLL